MPAKSQAQRRWAFGVKGAAWAKKHGYDNPGKLPARVRRKKKGRPAVKRKKKKGSKKKAGRKKKGRSKRRY